MFGPRKVFAGVVTMSVISNTPCPDEGSPTVLPNIVSASTDILPPSPACSKSNGDTPTSVVALKAELDRTERSLALSPSPGIKCENSLLHTVMDEDQTTYIPPAHPDHINIVVNDPSPQRTPCMGHSLLSQLPVPQESNLLPLNPIPGGCLHSTVPTPQPAVPVTNIPKAAQIAKAMYECTLGAAFEDLGKGFAFLMPFPEKEAVTKLLPDTFSHFQKELHRHVKPVEGHPIALLPHENDVWTEIFTAAHSFMSELSHYLGLLSMPFASGSMPPTPTLPSPPCIHSSLPPNVFSTDRLVSSANAIQAAVFAVQGRFITDSNMLDIAHNLAHAKSAMHIVMYH
ncbi:hypothetical protein CTheo_9108 [Ceratobasidium theobromae]|uniref:Uncharacterized protein n=1 Tax=Ceratobasidium theobromae TaxID=1582974 RepID=A0A5N5Q6R3_9AGAM|nr:hypothetical protein CTheo_9108 [Ceratobasidium theobromae]